MDDKWGRLVVASQRNQKPLQNPRVVGGVGVGYLPIPCGSVPSRTPLRSVPCFGLKQLRFYCQFFLYFQLSSKLLLYMHLEVYTEERNTVVCNLLLDEQGTSGEDQSDVIPTGRVIGVLQRNWRDYVASFDENEVTN